MPTVIGQKTDGTAAAVTLSKKAIALRAECKNTSTLEEIEFHLNEAFTGTLGVAICADGEGGKKPGALLSGTNEKQITVTAEATIKVTGLNVTGLKKGEFYWLVILVLGTSIKLKRTTAGTASANSTAPASPAKISEVTTWEELTGAPWWIAGVGTEVLEVTGSGKATVGVKANAAGNRTVAFTAKAPVGVQTAGAGHLTVPASGASVCGVGAVTIAAGARAATATARATVGVTTGAVGTGPNVPCSPEEEKANTGKNKALTAERPEAVPFTATRSFLARAYKILPNSTTGIATTVEVAICKDASGKPGAVIAVGSKAILPEKGVWSEAITLTAVLENGQVIAGQKYWVVLLASSSFTTKMETEGGGSILWRAKAKTGKKLSEVEASEWEEVPAEANGRFNGVVLGKFTANVVTSVTVGVTAKATGAKGASGASTATCGVTVVSLGEKYETERGKSVVKIGAVTKATGTPQRVAAAKATVGVQTVADGTNAEQIYYGPEAEEGPEKTRLGAGESCRFMEGYQATKPKSVAALILHGGGLVNNEYSTTKLNAKNLWEQAGIATFNVNYRTASKEPSDKIGAFPKEVEDIEAAVKWVIEHAAAFNIDPTKIFLVGGSAGAVLAALAGMKLNAAKAGTIAGVSLFSVYGQHRTLIKEMEEGKYKEPEVGKHPGGSAKQLIQNTQRAYLQTLDISNPAAEAAAQIAGYPELTSTGTSIAFQEAWSPQLKTSPGACKWLLFSAEEDLIPNNQYTGMKSKLEGEAGKAGRVQSVQFTGAGHGFSLWTATSGGKTGKAILQAWLLEPESAATTTVGVTTRAVGVKTAGAGSVSRQVIGVISSGGFSRTSSANPVSSVGITTATSHFALRAQEALGTVGVNTTAKGAGTRLSVAARATVGIRSAAAFSVKASRLLVGVRVNVTAVRASRGVATNTVGVRTSVTGYIEPPPPLLFAYAHTRPTLYSYGGSP